jgi:L-lactate dehydrogenase complex protein LldE
MSRTERPSAQREQPADVLFFGTCLIDLLDPEAGLAAMRLIERAGIRVRFPQTQTCCGQPAYNSGFRESARQVARLQLQALAGDQPVVVPSASCAGMFREQYPALFAGTAEAERAEQLAARVVELCDFLDRVLEPGPLGGGGPLRVALHHSCSARRETKTAPAAERLLARFPHLSIIEPDHAQECCGFGGTFAVKQPEISAAMAADKLQAIMETGASVLVSQDLGCLTNLDGSARKRGLQLRAVHVATLICEQLAGDA